MQKSDSIKSLAEALCKFQASMGAITKDATNPFFKSKYASLSAIIEDTREPLAKQGLSYAQFPSGDGGLETILMHSSGEWISESFQINPVDHKPQSVGSALSYGRRYALCSILGLQVEDDDGNEASKPVVKITPKIVTQTRDEQKRRIKELIDDITVVPLTNGEAYKEWVMKEVGLELVPEKYGEIVEALEGSNN